MVELTVEVVVEPLARNVTTVARLATFLELVGHPEGVLRGKVRITGTDPVQEM